MTDHDCRPPALIQCATALADALLADGLSMGVAGSTFGTISGDPVAAVIDTLSALCLDWRPDLYRARQQSAADDTAEEYLVSHMQHLLAAALLSEPVIL